LASATGRRHISVARDNHRGGGERRAARYADQRGIGERVAEQALHHPAAGGQQGADDDCECDPRQPDRPKHQPVALDECRIAGGKAESGNDAAERDTRSADRCGDGRGHNENDQ
jgi:hypothetical protein